MKKKIQKTVYENIPKPPLPVYEGEIGIRKGCMTILLKIIICNVN